VSKGTVFPAGTVVAIKKNHVLLDTNDGIKKFSFSQIERFIDDSRSLSQA
jgi:hypothetical protein